MSSWKFVPVRLRHDRIYTSFRTLDARYNPSTQKMFRPNARDASCRLCRVQMQNLATMPRIVVNKPTAVAILILRHHSLSYSLNIF